MPLNQNGKSAVFTLPCDHRCPKKKSWRISQNQWKESVLFFGSWTKFLLFQLQTMKPVETWTPGRDYLRTAVDDWNVIYSWRGLTRSKCICDQSVLLWYDWWAADSCGKKIYWSVRYWSQVHFSPALLIYMTLRPCNSSRRVIYN